MTKTTKQLQQETVASFDKAMRKLLGRVVKEEAVEEILAEWKPAIAESLSRVAEQAREEERDAIFKTLKEDKEFANTLPHPIEAIKFAMEQRGLKQSDMTPYFGEKSHTSEVLNLQRELSKTMIRRLMAGLGISAEVLIQEYELTAKKGNE